MESRVNKLLKNTAILSIGTLCTKAIMFIILPIITRLVSTEDYGTFDLLTTYITLLIPVLTLGLGEGTFRFLLDSKEEREKKNIIAVAIFSNILSFILAFIIMMIIWVYNASFRNYGILLLIYLISEIVFDTLGKIIRGLKKLKIYTISNILFVIGIAIGIIIFVWNKSMGLNGLLLSYIVGDLISNGFMIWKSGIIKLIELKRINKELIKKMLKYSLPLIISGISWWIVSVSDRTIVTVFLGTSINAIYAIANKIPSLCQTFYNVFQMSWLENASESVKDNDRDLYYNKVFNNMLNVLITVSILILSVNFILFDYIFTKDYYVAYYQSPILIMATFFNMIATFFGGIYVAQKKSKQQGETVLISAIINIIVHLCLIKFIGLYAASISTLVSYIVLYLIRYMDLKKTIKIKLNTKVKNLCVILIYFFISIYINNTILNYINLLLSICIFIYCNKIIIKKIINKLKRR